MANYDFRCKECDNITTVQIPMSEFDETPAPECHGPMKRIFNGHMAIKLRVKTGAKGQPYYGDFEQRERRMAAARKQANPGIG